MTTANNENILMMFEEISQKLDKANQQIEKVGLKQLETTNNEKIAKLKSTIETFCETQSIKLSSIEKAIHSEKRKIEFTPTSIEGMIFSFSLMAIILVMAVWVYSLRNKNATLSDNDLKFRYIQIQGNTTFKDFMELDTLFHFNRNSKKIKALRKQVEAFEENVRQRARILEQEERLKREKEKLNKEISNYH